MGLPSPRSKSRRNHRGPFITSPKSTTTRRLRGRAKGLPHPPADPLTSSASIKAALAISGPCRQLWMPHRRIAISGQLFKSRPAFTSELIETQNLRFLPTQCFNPRQTVTQNRSRHLRVSYRELKNLTFYLLILDHENLDRRFFQSKLAFRSDFIELAMIFAFSLLIV